MSDSGLSDTGIRLSCFIIGLIRFRTEGLQSDKFFSTIGQGNIVVGYRRQKYLMSRPPMSIRETVTYPGKSSQHHNKTENTCHNTTIFHEGGSSILFYFDGGTRYNIVTFCQEGIFDDKKTKCRKSHDTVPLN
jgi:hypothetical protein